MLILTRRTQEAIMIGDDVTVTVLGIKGNQIRLGIDAPRTVGVHREEIYAKIQRGEAKQQVSKSEFADVDAEVDALLAAEDVEEEISAGEKPLVASPGREILSLNKRRTKAEETASA